MSEWRRPGKKSSLGQVPVEDEAATGGALLETSWQFAKVPSTLPIPTPGCGASQPSPRRRAVKPRRLVCETWGAPKGLLERWPLPLS